MPDHVYAADIIAQVTMGVAQETESCINIFGEDEEIISKKASIIEVVEEHGNESKVE